MRLLLLLVIAAAVAACTPGYTIDTAKQGVHDLRLTDTSTLMRWNNHAIPPRSRLSVAGIAPNQSLHAQLIDTGRHAFAPFFISADPIKSSSLLVASQQAVAEGKDFLLWLEWLNEEPVIAEMEEPSEQFRRIALMITLVDVNSGAVVDKMELKAMKSRLPFVKDSVDELLRDPLMRVAEELSGG